MESERHNKIGNSATFVNAYQFERVPREIVYNVFARLDAKSLASAKCVCKKWNRSLDPRTLTLYCSSSNPSFLFRIMHYETCNDKYGYGYVVVDHRGKCRSLNMFNSNINLSPDGDVLSHGMLAYFPPYSVGDRVECDKIIVSHPSLRWSSEVALPSHVYRRSVIKGVHLDPSTFHFTILFGFQRKGHLPSPYEIYVYRSASREWRVIVFKEMSSEHCFEVQNPNGVYSQGCLFWIEGSYSTMQDKGLLIFNISEGRFNRMQLPNCPFLPTNERMSCRRPYRSIGGHEWKLKGCDGNFVLVHQGADRRRRSTDVYVWRLEQDEEKLRWNPELQIPQLTIPPTHIDVEFDKSRWSLWTKEAFIPKPILKHEDLIMLDDKGDLRHSIAMSDIISPLDIPSSSYTNITNIWVLEMNNLWDMLAFS